MTKWPETSQARSEKRKKAHSNNMSKCLCLIKPPWLVLDCRQAHRTWGGVLAATKVSEAAPCPGHQLRLPERPCASDNPHYNRPCRQVNTP
jgi:hypothetical protein